VIGDINYLEFIELSNFYRHKFILCRVGINLKKELITTINTTAGTGFFNLNCTELRQIWF
jgi:hypothetical protein